MKPMNALAGNELLWRQPRFGADHYELCQGESLFAEVYWTRRLSEAAVARIAGGWWTLDRLGWLRDRVVATVADTDQVVASFEFDWLKNGTIRLANGRAFDWYRTKAFANAWALAEGGGQAHLEIEHGHTWCRENAWVALHFPAGDPDLPLLQCLAMYLVRCITRDAAATTAATAAAFS